MIFSLAQSSKKLAEPRGERGGGTIVGKWNKLGGRTEIELAGTFDGGGDDALAEYDRIDVMGDVRLEGSLRVKRIEGHQLGNFEEYRIVDIGGEPTDRFSDLREGDPVRFFNRILFITYKGGDENDVALFTTDPMWQWLFFLLPRQIRYQVFRVF